MADIRINSLPTTASASSSDDYIAIDGTTNGTRKLSAYSPTFGGNLTVSGSANLTSSSLNSYIYDGAGWVWTSTGTSGGTVKGGIYSAGGMFFITANSSLATNRFSLNSSGDATIAGNLTVSGTGTSSFGSGVNLLSIIPSTGICSFYSTQATPSFVIGNTSAFNKYGQIQWIDSVSQLSIGTQSQYGTGALNIATNGNVLLGTTTNSGNGKLQLATHTTSAGGIGFGTALSMYRSSDNSAWIDAASGNVQLILGRAGTANLAVLSDGSNVYASAAQVGMGMILRTNGGTAALTLDSSQNATFAGKITANGAGSTFKGTATNDSAAAGYVGEYVSSTVTSASPVSLTSGTHANITSISLTAGDWDVVGNVVFQPQSTTVRARSIAAVNTVSGDVPALHLRGTLTYNTADLNAEAYSATAPAQRISISSTTTVYLIGSGIFSAGTLSAYGYIQARRVR